MGIEIRCPNGHQFKVKDKYAGKKGLCPYCKGQVYVRVPDPNASSTLQKAAFRAAAEKKGASIAASVFDEPDSDSASTSGSLLSSSVMRHNVRCDCGESVPMWFARCPKCGEYMPQR